MTVRHYYRHFQFVADMLACKHAIIGYLVGTFKRPHYRIDYRKGELCVTYQHSRNLNSVFERIAEACDTAKANKIKQNGTDGRG
ncbi:hypothetical protein [Streptococcus marmotae]|uniref:hypothetical protein n=1 Tax=Streptococcus marmotae TaxID=1825069 RepID=UPI000834C977|nr:hypothetical protein [Streptococcus marmotae]